MDGILIINKEENMTSRDVVNSVCKKLNTKKVGHTGTLDPMAKGVLVIAVGKALKVVDEITSYDKEYIAEVTLGIKTDTLDITGNVLEKEKTNNITVDKIKSVLNSFVGEYEMEVPKYSAIKVNGKKLYEYARNNIDVELPIKKVYVNSIELLEYKDNKFKFKCNVSKGTYIRSLIRDICNKLNVLGCMSDLIRTKQGKFSISDSIKLDDLNENIKLMDIKDALDLPFVEVDDYLYNRIKNGNKLENRYNYDKFCYIYNDKVIAIYVSCDNGLKVKPKKVLFN
jgi:tRNA pseudouridine55 synthase